MLRDQGSQFTAKAFVSLATQSKAQISMDGKGSWQDKVLIERLWKTLRDDHGYLHAYNFMSLICQVLLKTSTIKRSSNTIQHTLQTLRDKLFAKLAYLTTKSRKPIFNLAISMQQHAWIQGLRNTFKTFKPPAQFKPIYSP